MTRSGRGDSGEGQSTYKSSSFFSLSSSCVTRMYASAMPCFAGDAIIVQYSEVLDCREPLQVSISANVTITSTGVVLTLAPSKSHR